MTKYQERKFKNFVRDIEFFNRDITRWDSNYDDSFLLLKETRIDFLNWFKKQIK